MPDDNTPHEPTGTTMAQRITRAEYKDHSGTGARPGPCRRDLHLRLDGVLTVLFLVFNEGYLATGDRP